MIPYTRDAVSKLREVARVMPRDAIISEFGWSNNFLERVGRDHGIAIPPPVTAIASSVKQYAPLPQMQLEEFIARLPKRQAAVLTTLRAARLVSNEFIPASAIAGTNASARQARAVANVVGIVLRKMSGANLPFWIERIQGKGYRLKFTGAKI